ncbi:hypothetical protein EYF80_003079 [Liparis tanakae]|uniref:Uncharacterized protein n=1 Tax=Liparis tanakae TaxID=230148 RepID=A0A4Z2J9L8_9TELE|nr:hypothetical protein EYF80_003079 [Liparis tanakae]
MIGSDTFQTNRTVTRWASGPEAVGVKRQAGLAACRFPSSCEPESTHGPAPPPALTLPRPSCATAHQGVEEDSRMHNVDLWWMLRMFWVDGGRGYPRYPPRATLLRPCVSQTRYLTSSII